MKKYLMIIPIILFIAAPGFAQTKVGITAANFLTIPVGARASAMGGAFVAIANDATAAFWNPAGLSRLSRNNVTANYMNWLVGTRVNWFGAGFKFGESALGITINELDYGEEEITTAVEPNGTGQMWGAQDIAFSLSYAQNLTDQFSFGATVKYVQQKIWHESATAFAFDVGLLFTTQFNGLRIGMNIANFGTDMKMDGKDLLQPVDIDRSNSGNNANIVAKMETDAWALPLFFTVGLGMDAMKTENWKLTMAADATHPNNQSPFINIGAECMWNDLFVVRAGYNSVFKDAAEEGFTLGFGVYYDFGSFSLNVDYGYMDFGIFENISRYSLSVGF